MCVLHCSLLIACPTPIAALRPRSSRERIHSPAAFTSPEAMIGVKFTYVSAFCRFRPPSRCLPVQGVAKGESQIAKFGSGANQDIVWNLPFDVTWTSTNAFGWPRMVVEVRHLDFLGREVVLGYGSMLVPTVPGRYIRYIRTFAPVSGSAVQGFLAWLTANRPEFVRPDFVTENKGREGTSLRRAPLSAPPHPPPPLCSHTRAVDRCRACANQRAHTGHGSARVHHGRPPRLWAGFWPALCPGG